MPDYDWDPSKDELLQRTRGISFADVVRHIESGDLLATRLHPNQTRHPGQHVFIIRIEGYAYEVPFVMEGDTFLLRTIYPSRKATRDYLR